MDLEVNCIVACIVFLTSILSDAVCALDNSDAKTPNSMRCSSIVLIACLASPPIRQEAVFFQRLILGTGLAIVALVGEHHGTEGLRIADIAFTFVIGCIVTSSYIQGGTESLRKSKKSMSDSAPEFTKRDTVCALAISFLFYSSFRVLRQSITYAQNVDSFVVTLKGYDGENLVAPGYALMSVASLLSIGFGGTVGVVLAANLLASDSLRQLGTNSKREIMLIGGFLQFAAAFWATVALSDQQETLAPIFSASACASDACPAAGIARRFAMLAGTPTTLWINAFGCFLLAYGPKSNDSEKTTPLLTPVVVVWGMLATVACAAIVFAYSSFSGPGIYVEISTLISLAGVAIGAFWNNEFGSLVFAAGIMYDEVVSVLKYSLLGMLTYLTHCSIFLGVAALAIRTLVVLIVEIGWQILGPRVTDTLDDVIGLLTISGMSIFTFLYFATVVLLASYNGTLLGPDSYEEGPNGYARSMVAAVLEHWLPLLIYLPLYRSKQVQNVAFGWKAGMWVGTVALAVAIWVAALVTAGRDADHADGYTWGSQLPFVISVFVTCLVPWAAVVLI